MANNYLSKRELTEMITREVKAALKQPKKRTLRENEASAEEVTISLEEAVGTSTFAANIGKVAGKILGPEATQAIADTMGTAGDALQTNDAIGTFILSIAFMSTVTLVGVAATYSKEIKAAASKLKAAMGGALSEGDDSFAAAIADVAPEELKMAGKEGASAAKAKGLVK